MSYQMHRISILVVEDNQPMLDIAKSLLLAFGVGHVIGAPDGEVGYKRFCEYNPDIVIADWMMKPMDGITFTRMIRNDTRSPNHYVPVILMTGFSERRRVLQARDAGVTEFLVKPFNARDLYKRIAQVIERPRQFVRSGDFFGPDRRRQRAGGDSSRQYVGPYRRENDTESVDAKERLRAQQNEAHETLRKIREKSNLSQGDKFNIMNPNDIDML
jgi:two-component system, chemotaxis family, chemotaxis protein CheY